MAKVGSTEYGKRNWQATIRDVAKQAGVSLSTASRVLNSRGYYSDESKTAVLNAAKELGYRADEVARSLKRTTTRTIGLLITDIVNPFYAELARGVMDRARSCGLRVVISATSEDPRMEQEALETFIGDRVAGVIAVPCCQDAEIWKEIAGFGAVLVFVDRVAPHGISADEVAVDNIDGARRATAHLVELGHTRIGIISGPVDVSTGLQRLQGYDVALHEAGLPPMPELREIVTFKGESALGATRRLLELRDRPTAIFAANNVLSETALRVARDWGLSIPQELSMISFDDVPWMSLSQPTMTAVYQPTYDLGYRAVSILQQRLFGHESARTALPERFIFPTRLIVRESCAPPLGRT